MFCIGNNFNIPVEIFYIKINENSSKDTVINPEEVSRKFLQRIVKETASLEMPHTG